MKGVVSYVLARYGWPCTGVALAWRARSSFIGEKKKKEKEKEKKRNKKERRGLVVFEGENEKDRQKAGAWLPGQIENFPFTSRQTTIKRC